MKKLERREMKNLKGGVRADDAGAGGGAAECITPCSYVLTGCGSGNNNKACSTGPGTYDYKCC